MALAGTGEAPAPTMDLGGLKSTYTAVRAVTNFVEQKVTQTARECARLGIKLTTHHQCVIAQR